MVLVPVRKEFIEFFESVVEDVGDIFLHEVLVDDWCEDPAFGAVEDGVGADCA